MQRAPPSHRHIKKLCPGRAGRQGAVQCRMQGDTAARLPRETLLGQKREEREGGEMDRRNEMAFSIQLPSSRRVTSSQVME